MIDLKLVCDNCGSAFNLSFEEEEVSHKPCHCAFCGDFYDNSTDSLDFEDIEIDYFGEDGDDEQLDFDKKVN
jgi:hypothetical protein